MRSGVRRMTRKFVLNSLAASFCMATVSTASAEDWLRFRGPLGSGVTAESAATKWSPTENVAWKAELPGAGVSSPIVVGDKVFVTCYSGYGLDRQDPGKIEDLKRHLVCFSASTGKELWKKTVDAALPEDPYAGIGVTAHGYASHTPASDGERVFAFFGKSGVYAYDLEGEQLWHRSVGTGSDSRAWGSSSSPIVFGSKVYIPAAAESQTLFALDAATGEVVWDEKAGGFEGYWGTPTIAQVSQEKAELVVSAPYEVWAFDPETGKLRWYAEATDAEQTHSSPVVGDGVVYAFTGRGGGSIAIRAGGTDDVTTSHVVWKGRDSARFGSPVLHEGKLFLVAGGIVSCIDAATGKEIKKMRLSGGSAPAASGGERGGPGGGRGGRGGGRGFGSLDYASPIVADGKLYYLNGTGDMFVFDLETLEQISVNKVTDDSESFGGSPAVSGGRMFIRSNKHLYCVVK